MQPGPFAGQQVSVDHLPQQSVAELVAVRTGPGHQQPVGDHDPEGLGQLPVVEVSHGRQQPVGYLPASHRSHRQDLLGGVGQQLDPTTQQVPKRRRQCTGAGLDRGHQFLGEERVTLRTAKQFVDQVGSWNGA